MSDRRNIILVLIDKYHQQLLTEWLACQRRDANMFSGPGQAGAAELARRFLEQLRRGAEIAQFEDIQAPEWQPMRELLDDVSRDRAVHGYSPSDTALFVF